MDEARKWTDAKLENMEKELTEIYNRAYKENSEAWNDFMNKVGKEIAELEKAYNAAILDGDEEAKKSIGKKLGQTKREKTLLSDRFESVAEQTAVNLYHVNEIATAYINGQLPAIYSMNYNAIKGVVDSVVKGYSFSVINPNVVESLVKEKRILLPTKTIDKAKDIRWNLKKLNSEVLQGILQGESMDKIADRFQKVQDMNAESAIRNARTMVTAAENGGRWDSYDRLAKDGAIIEKFWSHVNDKKTRDWHREAGEIYNSENKIPYDEPFVVNGEKLMFPGDSSLGASGHNVYNCRCGSFGIVVGFNFDKVKK